MLPGEQAVCHLRMNIAYGLNKCKGYSESQKNFCTFPADFYIVGLFTGKGREERNSTMDYEVLYGQLQELEKQLKDKLALMQRLSKNVTKETEGGDLKGLSKDLGTLMEANRQQAALLQELTACVEGFDTQAYLEGGDFAGQMLDYCRELSIDVRGEYPVYEMFPYRVRFDTENQEIYLDRKKVQCMRPKSFVETVKAGQERLAKVNFNAQSFVNELADAYDLAVMKQKKVPDADIYLTSLYKFLAPMGRFRKDYDIQSFSFDVARLYTSGLETVKGGRRFQFGPSRDGKKALRILDSEGKEQFLATIRFFDDDEN